MRGKTHIWPRVDLKKTVLSTRPPPRTTRWSVQDSGFRIQDRSACLRRPASTWNWLAAKTRSERRTAAAKAKRATSGNYANPAALASRPSDSRCFHGRIRRLHVAISATA
ncbi:unnamed protein product [Ectocarpus sp. 12 AP-2014]